MRNRALIACLLLAAVTSTIYATDLAVIVHPNNPVRAMTLAEFGRILRGKSTTWPTGRTVTIVLRGLDVPVMKFLVEKAMGVGVAEAKTILTDPARKTTSPVVFADTDADVIKIVAANSSAIGIIDVYSITGGVKVIKIDDKQPFDPGYVLKGH